MSTTKPPAHAIILAGGRGTRFWPLSRKRTPKQLLNIVGKDTMLKQTADRLLALFPASHQWVITNLEQSAAVRRELPKIPARQILSEPFGRNTAAAIGLAAAHLAATDSADALMAVMPSDQYIADPTEFRRTLRAALQVAARPNALVVLGIPPTRPETGYGYVERAKPSGTVERIAGTQVHRVRRFTEKPSLADAQRYLRTKRYYWNAGMFFWRAGTLLEMLRRHLPKTHTALLRLAETIGTPRYPKALKRLYRPLENISIDYAVLEPTSRDPRHSPVWVLPAAVGWSDIGSWAAVYELMAEAQQGVKHGGPRDNVSAGKFLALDARRNFFWSPKKFVAAVGVNDLMVVETADALLVCPRDRAQEVGSIVKWLETNRGQKLL